MKKIFLISVLSLALQAAYASDITCKSGPMASCKTADMCVDYFDGVGVDLDMLEGACSSMEGEFSESGCNREGAVLSCLNPNNFMMPLIHFLGEQTPEDAAMVCGFMGGKPCP